MKHFILLLILRLSKVKKKCRKKSRQLRQEAITYFDVDTTVAPAVLEAYAINFKNYFPLRPQTSRYQRYYDYGIELLNGIYDKGVLPINYVHKGEEQLP